MTAAWHTEHILRQLLVPMALCGMGMLVFQGCQESRYERVVVSGTVTYQSKPLEKGMIAFFPTKGTKTSPSAGKIVAGQYRIDRLGGVPVGTHRIEIKAYDVPEGPRVALTETAQYLPAKYNTETIFGCEISTEATSLSGDPVFKLD